MPIFKGRTPKKQRERNISVRMFLEIFEQRQKGK
jgi:hypothetical protein